MVLPNGINTRKYNSYAGNSQEGVAVSTSEINMYTRAVSLKSGTDYIEYLGFAVPGTDKTDPGWLIQKNTWDGMHLTDTQFAGGSTAFDKIWNNRTTFSYS